MILDELAGFIQAVGFPVAVAAFLLWRMNGKLDRLTKAIDKLEETMRRHTETFRGGSDAERRS